MRIGEVTRRTGVAARMLRYYEDHDLLRPHRHSNGYREYSDSDVDQVTVIRDLNHAGVPTRFIKIILDRRSGTTTWTSECDNILALQVRDQINQIDSKIASLATSRESLYAFIQNTQQAV